MVPTESQKQYLLPKQQNQYIFEQRIRSVSLPFSSASSNPRAVFLGGQSGSGKSDLAKYVLFTFLEKERAVVVNSDALREHHPRFKELQISTPQQASFLVNPDTVIWQQKLIDVAIKTHRNLILDGTLGGNPEPILETMQMLREKGYQLQVSVLAVPARLSRLGIYKRYEDQVALKGSGRWVSMENHDRLYNEIPRTLALLEQEKVVDQIQILGRPIGLLSRPVLYDNRLINGDWETPPTAAQTLIEKRNRQWAADEQAAFRNAAQSVSEQMRQRGTSPTDIAAFFTYVELLTLTHRPARPDDVRLYFDWANDPDTRRQSFNSNPIPLETHEAWFKRKLSDPNALLLVFENESGEPVGQVRFERSVDADPNVIIGVSVDARFRGQGLAAELIRQGCAVCRERWGAVAVQAYIKPDNRASVRAFERAGFVFSHESGTFGVPSLVYVLQT